MFKELKVQRGLREIELLLKIEEIKEGKAFICGGYARYCLSPREKPVKPYDIDIYCSDEKIYHNLISYFATEGFEIRHDNAVAITYKKQKGHRWENIPIIQLIKPFKHNKTITTGTIEDILENFDFTVIRCALVSKTIRTKSKFYIIDYDCWIGIADEDFEEDENKKNLVIRNIHCPVSSLLRFMKYGRKGYNARPSQLMKLFADWDERPIEYKRQIVSILIDINNGKELTQEEIDKLEALLRID